MGVLGPRLGGPGLTLSGFLLRSLPFSQGSLRAGGWTGIASFGRKQGLSGEKQQDGEAKGKRGGRPRDPTWEPVRSHYGRNVAHPQGGINHTPRTQVQASGDFARGPKPGGVPQKALRSA